MAVTRGTSNSNERGSAESRRRRKVWLLATYAADRSLVKVTYIDGRTVIMDRLITAEKMLTYDHVAEAITLPTCRCYRCGKLLWAETLTVDRILPGCKGGTYRRTNIRPACLTCNSETGGPLANGKEHQPAKAAHRKRAKKVLVPS